MVPLTERGKAVEAPGLYIVVVGNVKFYVEHNKLEMPVRNLNEIIIIELNNFGSQAKS